MNMLEYYRSKPEDFMIKKHPSKDLYLIKYKHMGLDWAQPYALDARGIVLDGKSNVVARPYSKFFNYQELKHRDDLPKGIRELSEWDEGEYIAYEKLDGSLAVVSQYQGEMLYCSTGNMVGEYPDKFKRWFKKNLDKKQMASLKELAMNYTLLFEYVSPTDRIVVRYEKEEMILHGVISTKTGKEVNNPIVTKTFANSIGVDVAGIFQMSLYKIIELKRQDLNGNIFEGFVVKFKSGKRIKVKMDDYVELHDKHTIGFGSPDTKNKIKIYIDHVKDGTIDDLLAIFEDRGEPEVIKIINEVIRLDKQFENLLEESYDITSGDFNKRDYAVNVGTDRIIDMLVLNAGKERAIEDFREKFITESIKGGS